MMFLICSLLLAMMQAPATTGNASVSGRVLDAANAPIAGARVILMIASGRGFQGPPLQVESDATGRFVFASVVPGEYRLDVQKAGFAPFFDLTAARGQGSNSQQLVKLAAGQLLEGFDIHLQRGAVIAGRVFDPAGQPMIGARVIALRRLLARGGQGGPGGSGPLIPAAQGSSQQTNDLGEFRVFGLPAGEFLLVAAPEPKPTDSASTARTTLIPTYYPGTTSPESATPIAVAPGSTVSEILITVQSSPAFHISGIVVDEDGNPVANAMLMLMPAGSGRGVGIVGIPFMPGGARAQSDGSFTIGAVPPGTYRVTASVMNGGIGATGFSFSANGTTPNRPNEANVEITNADVDGVRVSVRR